MLVEIHMLKNFPATNLNRDDTGAPKNCIFGGIQRGRISSQCLKRSWRTSPLFQKDLAGHLGTRTRKMPQMVVEKLKAQGVAEEYLSVVQERLTGFGNKSGTQTKTGATSQVIFYAPEDIDVIAATVKGVIEECGSVKAFEKKKSKDLEDLVLDAAGRPVSLDIALWGRMVTSPAFADVEAAMQVAHAFSTNKVIMESDFFTAVDDMIDGQDVVGTGMMGDVDYNSACYYIYAALDTDKLKDNLKNSDGPEALVKAAVPALLRAMAYTNPSGKQNTFAGHSLPSAVLVECREEPIPVSYANAFVTPATANREKDLITDSIDRLMAQVETTMSDFPGLNSGKRFWFCTGGKRKFDREGTADCANFDELVNQVTEVLGK